MIPIALVTIACVYQKVRLCGKPFTLSGRAFKYAFIYLYYCELGRFDTAVGSLTTHIPPHSPTRGVKDDLLELRVYHL